MNRRIIRTAVVSAISIGALMLMPASSFAESPANCTKICVGITEPAVEVTILPEGSEGYVMWAPLLPKSAKAYNSIERSYFVQLAQITSGLCKGAEKLKRMTGATSYVEFSYQLAEFSTIRNLLNRLLNHYRLGFAPSIEDFSEAQDLDFILSYGPRKIVRKIKHGRTHIEFAGPEEESMPLAEPLCRFKSI